MTEIIEKLKSVAHDVGILYVEDNKGLRENMALLLTKFTTQLWVAEDGRKGYELYRTHHPAIIITDINMPEMSGFELAKEAKNDNPDVRIIFLSAFDDKEHLHEAIGVGVFRFLTKPTKVPLLITALYDAIVAINQERDKRIFTNQITDIFNYQNNLLMMLKEGVPLLVNQQFLDFFGVHNLESFMEEKERFDQLLLQHQGFLYSTPELSWFKQAEANLGKLFHTKIRNHHEEFRHLIMKLRAIPHKEHYSILSFDDITDLNLLSIFDVNGAKSDQILQEQAAVVKLMKVIKDNSAEVKLHNFYRGLTIVNSAILIKIENNELTLKTTHSQLKAIKVANNIIATSELFPYNVQCKAIKTIDFDEQTVVFSDVKFIAESATKREFIRLEPERKRHSVTLFYRDLKFPGSSHIVDISIRSVKIEIDALPAGLCVDEMLKISIVIDTETQPLNFLITGNVYRITNLNKCYHIVLLFELSAINRTKMENYLVNRQMELIREFKAL